MTAPADATTDVFTRDQLQRINSHIWVLEVEIAARCTEQRAVAGHALAVIVQTVYPGTQTATVHDIRDDGSFGRILCEVDGRIEHLAEDAVSPDIRTALTTTLRRLPDGTTDIWKRDRCTVTLAVTAALPLGDRAPFTPVQERLLEHLEKQTGRSIRRIEIGTELWDDGYFFSDTVEVDYCDGDGDSVYVEELYDFTDELRESVGDPGPRTTVTIKQTSSGITLD